VKKSPTVKSNSFLSKLNTYKTCATEIGGPKVWATSVFLTNANVNNRPSGENSHNLVTLLATHVHILYPVLPRVYVLCNVGLQVVECQNAMSTYVQIHVYNLNFDVLSYLECPLRTPSICTCKQMWLRRMYVHILSKSTLWC
jgi:hypothetical protein